MNDILRIVGERKNEIDIYFDFLKKISGRNVIIRDLDKGKQKRVDIIFPKILRANSFLLLYNLVEFSISQAITLIFKTIIANNIRFEELIDNLKIDIISNIKKNINVDDFNSLDNLSTKINSFYPKSLFSGNIDAKEFKKIAEKYGISTTTNHRDTRGGINLLAIKTMRNALAHGEKSFNECAQEHSLADMLSIKKYSINYIDAILMNIKDFIDNSKYIKV
jgi:hypothetical protein